MKVAILKKRGHNVFEVTEEVNAADALSLQASLESTFKATKNISVLDLTLAKLEAGAIELIKTLQLQAFKSNNDLFIIGPDSSYAQFPTQREATQLIISGASIAGIQQKIHTYITSMLTKKIAELEIQKQQMYEKYVVVEHLPFENKRLFSLFTQMMVQAEELLKIPHASQPSSRSPALAELEKKMLETLREDRFQVSAFFPSLSGKPAAIGGKQK